MLGKQHLDGLPIAAEEADMSRHASFHVRVMNGALASGHRIYVAYSCSELGLHDRATQI